MHRHAQAGSPAHAGIDRWVRRIRGRPGGFPRTRGLDRGVEHCVRLHCRDNPLLMRVPMIEPLDRSRRDSTLFEFTTRQLRDFIDPNHLLIRIDEQLDFAKLVAPADAIAQDVQCDTTNATALLTTLSSCPGWIIAWTVHLGFAPRAADDGGIVEQRRIREITELAKKTVRNERVRTALQAERLWPEIPVAAEIETDGGKVVIEGIIDLLYVDPTDGQLVVLDYKSDESPATQKCSRGWTATSGRARLCLCVEKATGKTVKDVQFLFVRHDRA